jgi:Ca2+-binding RTX toxin-like protein
MSIHQIRDPKTGQVIIEGDAVADNIHVKRRMTEEGEDGVIVESLDSKGYAIRSYELNAEEVRQGGGLAIKSGDGNDYIEVDDNVHSNLILDGGGDNDTVLGGGGNDIVSGGTGEDLVYGGGGRDSVFGNEGKDQLYGGEDADVVFFDKEDSTVSPGYGPDGDPGDQSKYEDIIVK